MNTHTNQSHTMEHSRLKKYCESKIHSLFRNSDIKKIHIHAKYDRNKSVSKYEKNDKLFNYKRPTAEIIGKVGHLYCFPGQSYLDNYKKIYEHIGYEVTTDTVDKTLIRKTLDKIFPTDFTKTDIIILGYVEVLVGEDNWNGNDEIKWKQLLIGSKKVAFVGVTFSFWGDIIYHLTEILSKYCHTIIYVGKLGSLNSIDIPNHTIASGSSAFVDGKMITWTNIFANSPLIQTGNHYTLPSIMDENRDWFNKVHKTFRFVDPELGWIAKSAIDNKIAFSYLHLVTDNLEKTYTEDLTTEREPEVINKRMQYIGILKAILWHFLEQSPSLMAEVLKAQQARVDKGLLEPLTQNWKACLSFAYHTQEEAWEVVRELPRRQWRDQVIVPENILSEIADTQIQLLTTLAYAGFTEEELADAVIKKLNAKRKDWK